MTAKKEKSRQKIMHAAKILFEQNGVDAVSFQQIADAADVCRTTVFNHFAGTRELMLAIFAQEMEDLTACCEESGLCGRENKPAGDNFTEVLFPPCFPACFHAPVS